jgi:hypothetical protein
MKAHLGRLLMRGYETFESGYAAVLSAFAANRPALFAVGRATAAANLGRRLARRSTEALLQRARVPSLADMEDVLAALARLEASERRLERQLDELRALLAARPPRGEE